MFTQFLVIFLFEASFDIIRAFLKNLFIDYYSYENDILTKNMRRQFDSFRDANSNIKLKNFTATKCILTYEKSFQNFKYKNVLTIFNISNAIDFLLHVWRDKRPRLKQQVDFGFCENHQADSEYCNFDATVNVKNLTIAENSIDYCLIQKIDEKCMLQFNLSIMLVVIICNLIKTNCIILIVIWEEW